MNVKVHRISSINDPETGSEGKQIELIESRIRGPKRFLHGVNDDDNKMVQGILTQFQSIGMLPTIGPIVIPKLTLFLTNSELNNLNLTFEVNDVLDISFNNGQISITRSNEGS
mgnify:CR=1 FL=1